MEFQRKVWLAEKKISFDSCLAFVSNYICQTFANVSVCFFQNIVATIVEKNQNYHYARNKGFIVLLRTARDEKSPEKR